MNNEDTQVPLEESPTFDQTGSEFGLALGRTDTEEASALSLPNIEWTEADLRIQLNERFEEIAKITIYMERLQRENADLRLQLNTQKRKARRLSQKTQNAEEQLKRLRRSWFWKFTSQLRAFRKSFRSR